MPWVKNSINKDRAFYVLDEIFHAPHRKLDEKQPSLMVFHRSVYLKRGTMDLKRAMLI